MHGKNESKKTRTTQTSTPALVCSMLRRPTVKPYFHYGCALRCVARDIETPIVFLFLSSRNATLSRNGHTALLTEIVRGLWSVTLEWTEFGCVHKLYPQESFGVSVVRRPKLVTQTGLIVRQYDRL